MGTPVGSGRPGTEVDEVHAAELHLVDRVRTEVLLPQALGNHGLLMPIHWGLFDLALHPWQQPIETLAAVEDLKLWSPVPGLPAEVIRGEELRSNWWR